MNRISRGSNCRKHGNALIDYPLLDERLPCVECWDRGSIVMPNRADYENLVSAILWKPELEQETPLTIDKWRRVVVSFTDEHGSVYEPFAWESCPAE